jgi:PAS domain S-box-containing protein
MQLLIPGSYILAGIIAYSGLHQFQSSQGSARNPVQLFYAGICLVFILFLLFHVQTLQAADPGDFILSLRWELSLIMLFMILLPLLIAKYTGLQRQYLMAGIAALWVVLLFVNLVQPYTIQYDHLDSIRTLQLPWGEMVTRSEGTLNGWLIVALANFTITFGYMIYVLGNLYRSTRQQADLWMLIAVGLIFLSGIEGAMVRLGVINFIEIGPYAFLGMLLVFNEALINRQQVARNEAVRLKDWQQTLLDSADYSIISTDVDGVIVSFNAAAQRMLGYDPEEVIGKKTPGIIHDPVEVARRAVELSDELGRTVLPGFEVFVANSKLGDVDEREWTYIRKDGSRFPVRLSVTALHGHSGEITGFLGIAYDLTERKASEEKIQHLAFYDHLTDLPNRSLLLDRLSQALVSSGRSGRRGSLLFIDLDNFKNLNDTLGHDIGDTMLKQVTQRLESCVREGDTVSRLGGDEFVVMLLGLSEDRKSVV